VGFYRIKDDSALLLAVSGQERGRRGPGAKLRFSVRAPAPGSQTCPSKSYGVLPRRYRYPVKTPQGVILRASSPVPCSTGRSADSQ
jgi:hypothetical protein